MKIFVKKSPEKQAEDMTYEECTAYMASIFKEYYQRIITPLKIF
jgi:hypothetical protein